MSKWLLSLPVLCTIAIWLTPEQATPKGTWVASADAQTASVSGRVAQPTWKKLNPVWWLLNDDEPDPPDWQLPGKPYLIRQLSWYARNPLQNFGRYVIGVSDRNYTVVGTAPVYATNWSSVEPGGTGWKTSTIHLGWLRLPYVSYESEHLVRRVAMVGILRLQVQHKEFRRSALVTCRRPRGVSARTRRAENDVQPFSRRNPQPFAPIRVVLPSIATRYPPCE
jgi:hypothetical protein